VKVQLNRLKSQDLTNTGNKKNLPTEVHIPMWVYCTRLHLDVNSPNRKCPDFALHNGRMPTLLDDQVV
jgi:hypothetical protein